MMDCNWMVTQAIKDRKALIGISGLPKETVDGMSWKEVTDELEKLGYKWGKAA